MTSTTWESRPELPDGAPPPDPRRSFPKWPAWMGVIAVPTALLIAIVGGLVVSLVGVAAGDEVGDPGPASNLAATIVQDVGFIATALLLARMVGPTRPGDFGLRLPRGLGSAVGWSLLCYGAIALVGAAAAAAFGVGSEEQDNVLESLGIEEGSNYVILAAAIVTVAAPLAEEVLFRGFVFTALRGRLKLVGAALASGLIFGVIHLTSYTDEPLSLTLASITTLSFFGFALALLYARTGSLAPCIALHAVNNSIAFGVMQDWGWQIAPLVAASLTVCMGAVWLATRVWPRAHPSAAATA